MGDDEAGGGLPRRGGWGGSRGRLTSMLCETAGTEGKAGMVSEHISEHQTSGTYIRRGSES